MALAARERHAERREEECRLRAAAAAAAMPGGVEEDQPIPLAALCTGEGLRVSALAPAAIRGPDWPWAGEDLRSRYAGDATDREEPAPFARGIEVDHVSKNVIETRLPDDRLSIRLDQASGGDVFRPDRHVLVGSLTEDESWRRKVDASLRLLRSEAVGLTVTGGYFDTRQPVLRGRGGSRRGVGAFTDWKENSVADLGLNLDLLDGRLRYAAAFSASDYGSTSSSRSRRRDRDARPSFDRDQGRSWWHKLEAGLWKQGSDRSASVYGVYGVVEPAYRALRWRLGSPIYYDGETIELGGTLRLGTKALSLTHQEVADEFLTMRETKGRLKVGPLSVAVSQGSWTFFDDAAGEAWWMREGFWKGGVKLALDKLLGARFDADGGLARFLPDSVAVKGGRTSISSSFLEGQPPDIRTRVGLSLAWIGDSSMTDLFLSRVRTDREGGASEEVAVDLTQSFFGDWWDVSAYVSVSETDDDEPGFSSRDRLYGGGVSFSIDGEEYPKISAGVDLNRFELLLPDIDYGVRDDGLNFNIALDFSKYLPELDPERKPYPKVKAYSDLSVSDETEVGETVETGQTFLAFFGMRF